MKWFFPGILVLVLLVAAPVFATQLADADLLALLQKAPSAQDYTKDNAVWLLREMEITIAPNGGTTVHEHQLIKLLNNQALALANWEIPYDKSCEKLEVKVARTLLHDQAYAADPAQVTESALYPGIGWYDALVVRRFPLPAAVAGAVLEVDTIIKRPTPRLAGEFSTRLHLQQSYPVRQARYIIHALAGMPLTFRFIGINPKLVESQEGGQRVYRWSVSNLPSLRMSEPQMLPYPDLCPSVRIASLPGWKPVTDWYGRITAGKDAVTDTVRDVANRLTEGCTTPEQKITVLHRAVSEMPYVALEMGNLSDIPHPAAEVLQRNYGDCKDKATLLKSLLKAVGIESGYVLVRSTDHGTLDRQLFSPSEFNHVILVMHLADGDHFLDPTIAGVPWNMLPPNVDGAEGLIIRGDGELVSLPAVTAGQNRTDIDINVMVKADNSATGTATLTFNGQLAMLQRGMLLPVPAERYREALEGTLAPRLGADVAITTVKVTNLRETEQPLIVTVDFSSPAYLQQAGPNLAGTLPVFAFQPNSYRTTQQRSYPFQWRMASSIHLKAVVTLPDGHNVVSLPTPVSLDGPLGTYRDETTGADRTITYTCDLAANRGTLPAAALDTVKAWASVLALEKRNGLQFYVNK